MWSQQLRYGDRGEAAEAAAELEELGYAALWIPDVGGPLFDAVGGLLEATDRTVVATGILNLWMHAPADAAAAHASLTAAHGDRFLMGIGVSHAPLVDAKEAGRYRRPLAAMTSFLDGLDAAEPPVPAASRVLAALGPKMQQTAKERSRGVHPYLVPVEHTRRTREALGDGPLVLPEQTAILCGTRDEARAIGTGWLRGYLSLPNYANNLLRSGFSSEDVESVSDRLFDALIAWGDEEAIKNRVDEHRAAGADHVCVQVLTADQDAFPRDAWRRLAPALLSG
ncbi:TIGR03620 family F420-dependent LLM class oxidoreductase [Actinomadura rifamycini]|uniref:TIGR03620 family F420-dependent LLM class oxidoreductase n=1 Tax=Actinomadura rifamycini TaxID=31962 RepID=UPI001FE0EB44|nr:TIGR03620 family F420-dependent LLM class oxidoreductase [Actinomadura rifamycini]